jgi:hypothetical protein
MSINWLPLLIVRYTNATCQDYVSIVEQHVKTVRVEQHVKTMCQSGAIFLPTDCPIDTESWHVAPLLTHSLDMLLHYWPIVLTCCSTLTHSLDMLFHSDTESWHVAPLLTHSLDMLLHLKKLSTVMVSNSTNIDKTD